MSKERLDQTKKLLLELIEVNKGKRNYAEVSINRLVEFLYAVEQAERVQELEIRCAEIAGESTAIEERSFKKINSLKQQNKRYREALKKIAVNFPFDTREDYVKIADEALGRESE